MAHKRIVKPNFELDEVVLHRGHRARVISYFESDESFRYIVNHSGWLWSVPESSLRRIGGPLLSPLSPESFHNNRSRQTH